MPKHKLTQIIEGQTDSKQVCVDAFGHTSPPAKQKPGTVRLLEETRKINSDIRKANQAAGADHSPDRWIPSWQRSEFGAGAGVNVKEDMPVSDHEYQGHRVIKQKHEPWHWTIEAIDFPTHPSLKNSTFTDVPSCERAIREYWAREKAKNQMMQ